jgi:pimeloyl-ACP methyl ester carboxylesterase
MTQWFIGRHAANPDPERFETTMRKLFIDDLTAEEKDIMLRPDVWRELLDSMRETWAQGADGYARDAKLMGKKWGFEMGDVDKKVLMWWGTDDDLAPVGMGRWMARRLGNARLREFEGDTHWTLLDRRGGIILRELMAK